MEATAWSDAKQMGQILFFILNILQITHIDNDSVSFMLHFPRFIL